LRHPLSQNKKTKKQKNTIDLLGKIKNNLHTSDLPSNQAFIRRDSFNHHQVNGLCNSKAWHVSSIHPSIHSFHSSTNERSRIDADEFIHPSIHPPKACLILYVKFFMYTSSLQTIMNIKCNSIQFNSIQYLFLHTFHSASRFF